MWPDDSNPKPRDPDNPSPPPTGNPDQGKHAETASDRVDTSDLIEVSEHVKPVAASPVTDPAAEAGAPREMPVDDLFAPPRADPPPGGLVLDSDIDEPPATVSRPEIRRQLRAMQHRPDTREVILAWCLWLLVTWALLGFGASPAAIRWMVFLSLGGMMMLWPMFRLSQDGFADTRLDESAGKSPSPPPRSALTPALILRDWLGMNIIFQAVIWPQIITGRWHTDQATFVSIAIAAWSLLASAMVAWGCQRRSAGTRTLAMVAILLIIWGEPLILMIARAAPFLAAKASEWTMRISPIEAIYALTEPAATFEPERWRPTLIAVLVAASIAWIAVAVTKRRRTT